MERSEIMRRVKSRDTTPERRLRAALRKRGLRFRLCDARLPGKPDIVFPKARLAVFIDGDYWHGNQWRRRGLARLEDQFARTANRAYWLKKIRRNVDRDFTHTASLLDMGWRVLRLWESDLEHDLDACAAKVAAAARGVRIAGTSPRSFLARRTAAALFGNDEPVCAALEKEGWRAIFVNDAGPRKQPTRACDFNDGAEDAGRDGAGLSYRKNIRRLSPGDIPTVSLATASLSRADFLRGKGQNRSQDRQPGAFWDFVRLLKAMGAQRPPLVLIETVQGILSSRAGADFRAASAAFAALGYRLEAFILNVPLFTTRIRPRLFMVGMSEKDIVGLSLEDAARARSPLRPPELLKAVSKAGGAQWRLAPLPPAPRRRQSPGSAFRWIARHVLTPAANSLLRGRLL